MTSRRTSDLIVIAIHFVAVAAIGLRFARRAIPHRASGLSVLAAIVISITFIAYPGAAFQCGWNRIVPGFMAAGYFASFLFPPETNVKREWTFLGWLEKRKLPAGVGSPISTPVEANP